MSRDSNGVMHYPTITEIQANPLYSIWNDIGNELSKSVQIAVRYGTTPPTVAPPVSGDLFWKTDGIPKAALYVYNGTGWENTTASIWAKIDELFYTYTEGVNSPGPNTFTANSISGFEAYNSTDFGQQYEVGLQVFGTSNRAAQISFNWNFEDGLPAGGLRYRVNDDSGNTSIWSQWATAWDSNNLHPTDYLNRAGGLMTGNIDLGGNLVKNSAAPVDGPDLVNMTYVDDKFMAHASTNWDARGYQISQVGDPLVDTDVVNKKFLKENSLTTIGGLPFPQDVWDAKDQKITNVKNPEVDSDAVNLGFLNLHKLEKDQFEQYMTLVHNGFTIWNPDLQLGFPTYDISLYGLQSKEFPHQSLGANSPDVNLWGMLGGINIRGVWESQLNVSDIAGSELSVTIVNHHTSKNLLLIPKIRFYDATDDDLSIKLEQYSLVQDTSLVQPFNSWVFNGEVFQIFHQGPGNDAEGTWANSLNGVLVMNQVSIPPKTMSRFVISRMIGGGSGPDRFFVNRFMFYYMGFQ